MGFNPLQLDLGFLLVFLTNKPAACCGLLLRMKTIGPTSPDLDLLLAP
jgi:hypothetical protein